MPHGVRICKVCGAEYPYCKTENRGNRFRYQDVACCPEHGSIYFSNVAASRGIEEAKKKSQIEDTNNIDFSSDWSDDDEEFDEDIEDEEDELD